MSGYEGVGGWFAYCRGGEVRLGWRGGWWRGEGCVGDGGDEDGFISEEGALRCEESLELSWTVDTRPYWSGEARPECERDAPEGEDVASGILGEGVPDGGEEAGVEIRCLFSCWARDCVVLFAIDDYVIVAVGYGRRF